MPESPLPSVVITSAMLRSLSLSATHWFENVMSYEVEGSNPVTLYWKSLLGSEFGTDIDTCSIDDVNTINVV